MSTGSYASSALAFWNARRAPARLLADRNDGREVGEHVRDAQPRHVLRQVAPVRPDVAHRRGLAALVGLEAPAVVGVEQQPVLQVLAVDEARRPNLALGDHRPRLLHQRVAAVVERHRVHHALGGGGVEQFPGLGRGHRQRLVRHDVLAGRNRRHAHRVVHVVGRRVVHHVHIRIGQQRLVAAVRLRHAERLGLLLRQFIVEVGDRDHVHEPESTHRLQVMRTDEPRPDQTHPDSLHRTLLTKVQNFRQVSELSPATVEQDEARDNAIEILEFCNFRHCLQVAAPASVP